MRRSTVLTTIRVLLGLVFVMYGLVKVLGGQYDYGDWVMDKKTVSGTSLVWAFYGYSPIYDRFTGLFELGPAILIMIPRTATIGAALLFAVAINVTVMDFAYHYPAVKYFALLYTVALAGLLWADRGKLRLLLVDEERARLALATIPPRPLVPMGRVARRVLAAAVVVIVLGIANVLATSLSGVPVAAASRAVAAQAPAGSKIEFLRYYQTGFIGVHWTATMDFAVTGPGRTDTVRVAAQKTTGFLPWKIEPVGSSIPLLDK